MRKAPGARAANKRESLDRILDAAARRLREEGIDGAAIVPVMRDAGLTHGAFYSHFSDKDDLPAPLSDGRSPPAAALDQADARRIMERAAFEPGQALPVPGHRDDLATSCGFATLSSDAAHASDQFRASYEHELRISLAAICGDDESDDRLDDAIALMVMCVGGMALSRAVADPKFSTRILRVAREAAAKLSADQQD